MAPTMTTPPPEMLTQQEAADLIGCGKSTIVGLVQQHRLPRHLGPDGHWLYSAEDCRSVYVQHRPRGLGADCRCAEPAPDHLGECARCRHLVVIECPTCAQPIGYPAHRCPQA